MHTKIEQFSILEYNILGCTASSRLPTPCVSAGGGGSPDITADTVCAADLLCRLSLASAEVHLLPQGQHPVHSSDSFCFPSILYSVRRPVSLHRHFHNLSPSHLHCFPISLSPLFFYLSLLVSFTSPSLSLPLFTSSLCSPPLPSPVFLLPSIIRFFPSW